jgi:NCAIR mutase (PurE)-related protein
VSDLQRILEALRDGRLDVTEAVRQINHSTVAELGYANVDLHRRQRCGFPEVIFCEGKTPEWVAGVVAKLHQAGQDCLATRVSEPQSTHLRTAFPLADQDRLARTFWLPSGQAKTSTESTRRGRVTVVTAGTADLPVAQEAVVTARVMGCEVELVADVGVAGIHRLLRNLEGMQKADAIIVVAGMEAALPSVVGGLVDCPVIGVPTSVGYGASFGGLAALLGILNSCAANVTVVNIDSGFKGGYVAALIARRAALGRTATEN